MSQAFCKNSSYLNVGGIYDQLKGFLTPKAGKYLLDLGLKKM